MDSYMLFTRAKIHLVKCIYGYLCKITIMYIYHKYIENLDSVLNGRLPLSKLSDTIKTHKFQFKGKKKEYWIHNLQIIADETSLNFYFVNDIECFINDGWICQECTKKEVSPFHFYETDSEETYTYYESKYKDCLLQLQVYQDFFLFKIVSEKKLDTSDMKLFYII